MIVKRAAKQNNGLLPNYKTNWSTNQYSTMEYVQSKLTLRILRYPVLFVDMYRKTTAPDMVNYLSVSAAVMKKMLT